MFPGGSIPLNSGDLMRFLILLAVLAGCKSSPVQYEIIEVHGEKLSNMRGSVPNKRAGVVLEMQGSHTVRTGPCRCLLDPCRAIPGQTGSLPTASGIDVGGGTADERRTPARNQAANAGIGLSAGD